MSPGATHLRERFAGQPVKPVVLTAGGESHRGEFVVTANGVEGSGIYPLSATLRDEIEARGMAMLTIDLLPDYSPDRMAAALAAAARQPLIGRASASHGRHHRGQGRPAEGILPAGHPGRIRLCLPVR
jgi:predicted flavoprotein YhiN